MTIARKQIIDPSVSRYYHCIARCVRQSYLCGEDSVTGKNFDHRKVWLVDRMRHLAEVFAVDLCAYAVLSNHYHIVLYWNIERGSCWSEQEVVARWCQLYGNPLGLAYLNGEKLLPAQRETLSDLIVVWRKRLMDISWYMRCLNEYIARKANGEDECTGHFWEGRFRSQALLDEASLLSCMAYVDLNPIRAGVADRLEDAEFTSIQERLRAYEHCGAVQSMTPEGLLGFADEEHNEESKSSTNAEQAQHRIPYRLLDYLQLVDWTGRSIRMDQRGSIPAHVPSMLRRLGLVETSWLHQVKRFQTSKTLKMSVPYYVAG